MDEDELSNISSINIECDVENSTWKVEYVVVGPSNYDPNRLITNSEEKSEYKIEFGKNQRTHYITNNNGNNIVRVFLNKDNHITLQNINRLDLSLDEQYELMTLYVKKQLIPEWFAIAFMIAIKENEASNEDICSYFTLNE
jgi:hypothetical protein